MTKFHGELQTVVDKIGEENNRTIIRKDWKSRIRKDERKGMGDMVKFRKLPLHKNGRNRLQFCFTT